MEESEDRRVYFYITGFGKFFNIVTNPSSVLVNRLPELFEEDWHLAHHEIVTVSIEDCETSLSKIYQVVNQNIAQNKGRKHIVINFGVAAARKLFSLEMCGKNIQDFRCKDERGNQPLNLPIDSQCAVDFVRKTTLDLEKVRDGLKAAGHTAVECSQNAGEFICNYMYYRNLDYCSACNQTSALFVHIPSFSTIPEEDHVKFAKDLLVELAKN